MYKGETIGAFDSQIASMFFCGKMVRSFAENYKSCKVIKV